MPLTLTPRELARYKLTDLIRNLHEGKGATGFAREVAEKLADDADKPFDSLRPMVPWQVFARDLTVSGTSGASVGTDVHAVADILRPVSVALRAGAQVLSGLTGNLIAPRISASATGYWLTNEGSAANATDPTFSAKEMKPKTAAAVTKFSRQLDLQSQQTEIVVRRHLLRLIGSTMDAGILAGTGADGQPEGLLTVTGTQTQSGTSLDWAGVTNMVEQAATNNADDEAIVFVAPPTVRELLAKREVVVDTGRFIWSADRVADKRAYSAPSMPAASMIAGDFGNVLIGLWGSGPEISIDPFSGFQTGVITMRCFLSMDVAILAPGAFCKSSSIT